MLIKTVKGVEITRDAWALNETLGLSGIEGFTRNRKTRVDTYNSIYFEVKGNKLQPTTADTVVGYDLKGETLMTTTDARVSVFARRFANRLIEEGNPNPVLVKNDDGSYFFNSTYFRVKKNTVVVQPKFKGLAYMETLKQINGY